MRMRSFFACLAFFVGFMLFASANWIVRKFGEVTYEQIIFHLNMPFSSETRMIASYCKNTFMTAAIIILVLYLLIFFKRRAKLPFHLTDIRNFLYNWRLPLSLAWLVFCLVFVFFKMNVWQWVNVYSHKFETSSFYEQHYVAGQDIAILPPNDKRNLVLIFAESMETTFAKTSSHDYYDGDLIPELGELAQEGVTFSDTEDYFGGSQEIDGTQWTQAGLLAQTCGIPIQLPINDSNMFHPKHDFYPKAYCLYDVLKDNGYALSFLIGSNGEFAGMDKFVKTHGDMRLLDTKHYAEIEGFWRGLENTLKLKDAKVFSYAKEELARLAQQKEPFALTLMTLDTHYASAVFDEDVCARRFSVSGEDYNNFKDVLACSSYQIGEFVDWLKAQDFYNDTVVIIVGDHLAMNSVIFKENMARRPINIFLNAVIGPAEGADRNRSFTPFDIYPTIVEALGFTIPNNRLALGTSLFSGAPTLLEKEGVTKEYIDNQVRQHSLIYDWLLFGKQVRNVK